MYANSAEGMDPEARVRNLEVSHGPARGCTVVTLDDIRKRADSVITVSEFVSPRTAAIITELCGDRLTLLAEVDRLTATPYPEDDIKDERARILAAVEAQAPDGAKTRDFAYALGWDDAIASVIVIVKGETT